MLQRYVFFYAETFFLVKKNIKMIPLRQFFVLLALASHLSISRLLFSFLEFLNINKLNYVNNM